MRRVWSFWRRVSTSGQRFGAPDEVEDSVLLAFDGAALHRRESRHEDALGQFTHAHEVIDGAVEVLIQVTVPGDGGASGITSLGQPIYNHKGCG